MCSWVQLSACDDLEEVQMCCLRGCRIRIARPHAQAGSFTCLQCKTFAHVFLEAYRKTTWLQVLCSSNGPFWALGAQITHPNSTFAITCLNSTSTTDPLSLLSEILSAFFTYLHTAALNI